MTIMLDEQSAANAAPAAAPLAGDSRRVALAVAVHPVVNLLPTIVTRLYPVSPEVQKALQQMEQILAHAPRWQLIRRSRRRPGDLRRIGLPRIHPLRAAAHRASLAGDHLQRRLLRRRPRRTPTIAHRLLRRRDHRHPGGADRESLALHPLPRRTQLLGHCRQLVQAGATGQLAAAAKVPPTIDAGGLCYKWPVVVVGGLAAILIIAWFVWLHAAKSPEEELQEAIDRGSQRE